MFDVDRMQASFGRNGSCLENIPQDIHEPGYTRDLPACRIPEWMAAVELPEFRVPIRVVEPGRPHAAEIFHGKRRWRFR